MVVLPVVVLLDDTGVCANCNHEPKEGIIDILPHYVDYLSGLKKIHTKERKKESMASLKHFMNFINKHYFCHRCKCKFYKELNIYSSRSFAPVNIFLILK